MDDTAADADWLRIYKLPVPAARAAEIITESDPSTISSAIAEAIAFQFANEDPEAAIKWAAGLDDSLSLPAARAALERWVALDSDAAMTYAAPLPDSAFQAAAATTIVTERANLDRTATQEWIEHLEPGPFGDTAAQVYITSSKGNDSNDLVPLAATITNDAQRREALLHIMDQSPGESSRQLIENPILSDTDRTFLENAQF